MINRSPLRYPGGKACLGTFFAELIQSNNLVDGTYVEPFAGGAGVAIHLLLGEYVSNVLINDLDERVCAFWRAVLANTDEFCERIFHTPLTPGEWDRQKSIFRAGNVGNDLDLGFATFYLNRTNRSGIMNGGIIGGRDQSGGWGMDARFNRDELVRRVRRIGCYRGRIQISCEDALVFLRRVSCDVPSRTIVYLDPPYFEKGQHLYANFYRPADHGAIADFLADSRLLWVVTYDDVPEIRKLYSRWRIVDFQIGYSARARRAGKEVMVFADDVNATTCGLELDWVR